MSIFGIKIDAPVFERSFTASYSRVERLTGVQYLLLKLIGTGPFQDKTWRDVMDIMRIPDEVYEKVFEEALVDMASSEVIELDEGTDIDSKIGSIKFTVVGKQAFDMGVITQQIEDFRGTVAFKPWESRKKFVNSSSLRTSEPSESLCAKFANSPVDLLGMQTHVENEKHLYGVTDKDARVFDVKFGDNGALRSIRVDLTLSLNDRTGEFEVSRDTLDRLDDAFLKNKFDSESLIRSLSGLIFESRDGLKVMKWRDSDPEWTSMTFYTPFDVKKDGSDLVILNKGSCTSEGDVIYSSLEGCDMMVIKSSGLGYAFCFVMRPTTVTGHDGQEMCRIAVRRTMDKEEIERLVASLVGGIDLSDADGLARAIRLSGILKNDELTLDIVKEHLGKVPMRTAMKNLESYSGKLWFRKMPEIVEGALCDKNLDTQGILREMQGTDMKIPGHEIVRRLRTGSAEVDIVTVDDLSDVLKNPEQAISDMSLNEYIAESILSGRSRDFKYGMLASASNAAKLLQRLKGLFGMKSLSDYSFDLESFDSADYGSIGGDIATFGSDVDKLKPVIGRTSGYREISEYKEFFEGVSGFFSEKKGYRSAGIELGVRLENLLKMMGLEGTLDEMLRKALNSKLVSDGDYMSLDSLRQYRNACAHQVSFEHADKKKMRFWTSLVERLEGERKGGST